MYCSSYRKLNFSVIFFPRRCVQYASPGVDEDELEVETGAEHEHVAIETHLGDGTARQRVANGDQPDVVVAVLYVMRSTNRILAAHFDIARTVDHLRTALVVGRYQRM